MFIGCSYVSLLEKLLNMPSSVYNSTSTTSSTTTTTSTTTIDGDDCHDQGDDDDDDDDDGDCCDCNDGDNEGCRKIVTSQQNVVLFTDYIINPIDHHCISSLSTEHPHINIITCNSNMLLCMSNDDDIESLIDCEGDDDGINHRDDDEDDNCSIWPSKLSKQVYNKVSKTIVVMMMMNDE